MRIEKLRFCNINSLRGTWSLDLEDPALLDSGLFLITGPTGSGKSTLLDAICLALYGQTPRLAKISQSSNEVMTRHTGSCFSEVVYSTDKGRYRVRWAQIRAYKKAGRKLQPPECEFEDYATPGKAETRVSTVRSLVEETTGMNFEQFTRSMLLAQGQFAKFLQASSGDRTTILEQITGTEIYSRISKSTFERAKAENERYTTLKSRLEGIQILTDEERKERQAQLEETKKELWGIEKELLEKGRLLSWMTTRENLETSLARARQELARAGETDRQCARERDLLALDAKAATLDAPLFAVSKNEASVRRLAKDLATQEERLPDLEKKALEASEQVSVLKCTADRAEEAFNMASPTLARVRELDAKLATVREQQKQREKEREEIRARGTGLGKRKGALQKKKEACLATLASVADELEKTARDASLAGDLRAIDQRLDALKAQAKILSDEQKALSRIGSERAKKEKELARFETMVTRAREASERLAVEREKAQEDLLACLAGARDLQALRETERGLGEISRALARVGESLGEYLASMKALRETEGELQNCTARERELSALLPQKGAARATAEERVRLLEENLRLKAAIQSLADHRAGLKKGEPCPCCGALEHPWASGVGMNFADDTELSGARADLEKKTGEEQKILQDVRAAKDLCARLETDVQKGLETLNRRKTALADQLAPIPGLARGLGEIPDFSSLEELCAQTKALTQKDPAPEPNPELADTWDAARKNMERLARDFAATVRKAEELEKALQKTEKEQEKSVTALAKVTGERDSARVARDGLVSQETEQKIRAENLREELSSAWEGMLKTLDPYGLGRDELEKGTVSQTLHKRLALRQNLEQSQKTGEEEKAAIEKDMATLATSIAENEKHLKGIDEGLDALKSQHAALDGDRKELFGDKDPGAEEKRLRDAVTRAKKALESAISNEAQAQTDLVSARTKGQALAEEAKRAQKELEKSLSDLDEGLAAQGFASREALIAARLDEKGARRVKEAVEKARDNLTRATASFGDCERALAEHMQGDEARLAEGTQREGLEESLKSLSQERNSLQQTIGVISEQLEHDARERARRENELRTLENQRSIACQWQDLSSLIGSADGAKFRRFAQSVTFARLVACANTEMKSLTDRYLLTTDPQNALEFNVIDTYQGNEQRSIRNLSGGETFLVSLALALGLAHLSGGRMRIETMFLDEGFGTLDPETLDGAINTLAALRGRGTGLIGIISHVEALQERVDTQIVLSRGADGVSTLSGPGCGKG